MRQETIVSSSDNEPTNEQFQYGIVNHHHNVTGSKYTTESRLECNGVIEK